MFLTAREVKLWKRLPGEAVGAPILSVFWRDLDNALTENLYLGQAAGQMTIVGPFQLTQPILLISKEWLWLNQKGVALSVCSFTQCIPRTAPEAVWASCSSLSALWVSLLASGISQHGCYLGLCCWWIITTSPLQSFSAPWSVSDCIPAGVYFLPLCWKVSGWCCWHVGSYYCLPQELLRAVHHISGDNCCVRKHFRCPSRTLRLHPKIPNREVWNSWKILLNLLDQCYCFHR